MEHLIQNPIIRGFYPDPSICRVGDDFYIANSSFELCPGIPIFHSRDLAHWKQIGYAMTPENGFYTDANLFSGGVMAPTIRYHKGTFYIINCNFGDKGNFIVTAKNPEGPWSEPHWITDIGDIDCSIFFDDDKCYLVSPGEDPEQDNNRAFYLTPYDIENFRVCGERKKIWNSAMRGAWAPESPHLYRVGDYYYLMIAEGGTEHNHSVMIARSKTIDGWYEGNPANPVLTHRHFGWDYPIENIGHADLVETKAGRWYAVMLGVRIIEGQHMNMGRETFICPVEWQRGWPVFSKCTGKVEESYPADPDLPWNPENEQEKTIFRDEFEGKELGMDWSFWGTPKEKYWKLENGHLSLKCLKRPMARKLLPVSFAPKQEKDENVSFVGIRQRDIDFSFEISMDFEAKENESAGMVILQQCNHQYRLEKKNKNGRQHLALVLVTTKQKGLPFMPGYESETKEDILKEEEVPYGATVIIKLVAKGQDYSFYIGENEDQLHEFYSHADGRKINPEEVGGMVGTMLGMFASGNGTDSDNEAHFGFAQYEPGEQGCGTIFRKWPTNPIPLVEDLLGRMTLEEKVGQLNQESPSIVGGFDVPFEELIEMVTDGRISQEEFGNIMANAKRDYHEDDIRAGMVSSFLDSDPRKINELQRIAVEESRLGIPLLIGFDVIHGLRSVYPIAIAEAGSFDDELMEKTARMAAKESRAHGVSWNFAPMIDVARDSRWGRVSEGPGEDPFLASKFARAKIKGLQNGSESGEDYVAACTKHYVGYSACEAGRDYNTTSMSISQLYNVYLPPFKAAMEEGACSAMASFNDLNGVPCTVNSYTLRDILKGEFGLEGFVVSDANGIKECVVHGIAEDDMDAGVKAMNAGLDMDMGTRIYYNNMVQAVKDGKVSMETLDDAVRRILSVKVWLGLFENPYVDEETIAAYEKGLPQQHRELCLKAAEESIVLLKNEGDILPIKKGTKFTLVGELADREDEVVGAWALGWKKEECVSVKEGLLSSGADFDYYPVCGPEGEINEEELKSAISSDNEIVIAVVGEYKSMSGEASSKADITLPGSQREMLKRLKDAGKTVICVLMNGRPLALGWEAENIPAIIEGWHLGIEMGTAIAKVIFGDVNPSGKLSSTFASVNGQEPLYYNHPNTGRPGSKSKFTSRYLDAPVEPCFPFGYGLSYTSFEYSDLKLNETDDEIQATVTLKNTGKCEGTEVVQLYMQDVCASLVRPVKELKNYARISLDAGESTQVSLNLKKSEMGFYDNQGKYVLESGLFRIFVGGNSRDTLEEEIRI